MIRILSESQLLDAFRPIDRGHVRWPADFRFPLAIRNFTSWIEPSGHRAYLVFEDAAHGGPAGIVFQRTPGSPEAAPAMCQWCNKVGGGSAVSLMTAEAGSNRRVGIHLCSDLKCGEETAEVPCVHDMRESLDRPERLYRIMRRINEFAGKNLF
jgi:hypothetical protein